MSKRPSTIAILVLISLVITALALFYVNRVSAGDSYIRGRYGSHCYIKGQENRAIKPENKLTFPTLESCVQSLND